MLFGFVLLLVMRVLLWFRKIRFVPSELVLGDTVEDSKRGGTSVGLPSREEARAWQC